MGTTSSAESRSVNGPVNGPVCRVFLVHGTFAPEAPWATDKGSAMRIGLAREFDQRVEFVEHRWSAANKHIDRVRAARKLRQEFRRRQAERPLPTFIVAHSHAGNIAMLAFRERGKGKGKGGVEPRADARGEDEVVNAPLGIACLATPFLTAERRDIRNWRLGVTILIALLPLVLIPSCVGGSIVWAAVGSMSPEFRRIMDSHSSAGDTSAEDAAARGRAAAEALLISGAAPVAQYVAIGAGVILFVLGMLWLYHRLGRWRERLAVVQERYVRMFSPRPQRGVSLWLARAPGDEAEAYLTGVDWVAERPFVFLRLSTMVTSIGCVVLGGGIVVAAVLGWSDWGSVRSWMDAHGGVLQFGFAYTMVFLCVAAMAAAAPTIWFAIRLVRQRKWGFGEDGLAMSLTVRLRAKIRPTSVEPESDTLFDCRETPGRLMHSRVCIDRECIERMGAWMRGLMARRGVA